MANLRDSKSEIAKREDGPRLSSLDAARGATLLLFVGSGFGIREILRDDRWTWITNQWSHREWNGCSLWDTLPVAMLFFVGIAMTHSYSHRQGQGQSWSRQLLHAVMRTVILVGIGLYLDSYRAGQLVCDMRGELQQIGLAYLIAFLVVPLGMPVQGITVGFLLVGHLAAYVIFSIPSGHDFLAKEHNVGLALDTWLRHSLRMTPHLDPAVTLNFVPGAAIVLIGVLVAGLVRSGLTPGVKIAVMTGSSMLALLAGWLLSGGNGWIDVSWPALVPMVRPLMSTTFVFTAVGWTLLCFAYFYLVMDGLLLQSWAIPFGLMGRNSLLLYVGFTFAQEWAKRSARLILPASPSWALSLQPLFVSLITLALFWVFCLWLYRRRIFFKL